MRRRCSGSPRSLKTFTATAVLQLRDEGKLHLDDPAVVYLPELRDAQSPFGAIETVTLRRMLSHESGLMGDPPGARWFHDVYESSPQVNLARAAEIATRIPPNVQQKYSNMAFQLLGEIVARLSGPTVCRGDPGADPRSPRDDVDRLRTAAARAGGPPRRRLLAPLAV
jgi:hypothetical protein